MERTVVAVERTAAPPLAALLARDHERDDGEVEVRPHRLPPAPQPQEEAA